MTIARDEKNRPGPTSMSERIFVSCASEDREHAALSAWLRDKTGVELSAELREGSREKIQGADRVAVVWSKNAESSAQVEYEVAVAVELGKPISVLHIDDVPVGQTLPLSGYPSEHLQQKPVLPAGDVTASQLDSAVPAAPKAAPSNDPFELRDGDLVDHFRVVKKLDEGGMGKVYLARDLGLGRLVAIKMMRREYSDRAKLFIQEGKATAKLNHPNIVGIYGHGIYLHATYLVLEFLEGDSLYKRSKEQPVALREALRISHAIALALEHMHANEMLHCDLKPANVMLSKDGIPRVVDFGLARDLVDGDKERVLAGTKLYMAPEQLRNEPLAPPVDVYALGLMMFELLEHRHPFSPDQMSVLSPRPPVRFSSNTNAQNVLAFRELIVRCLDNEPARRPIATALAAALKALLDQTADARALNKAPFPGLSAFSEDDARDFFGREKEIAVCVERLREETTLAIVGPSGAGKSSFVRAGVIPRMREQGPVVLQFLRPGVTPVRTLAAVLAAAQESGASTRHLDPGSAIKLEAKLRRDPKISAAILAEAALRELSTIVLYIDQLEELFTHEIDAAEIQLFLEVISSAADYPGTPVRVIVTLREEFIGRLASSPAAQRAFHRFLLLGPMGKDALREVIRGPLRNRKYEFADPQTLEEMVSAVDRGSAGLPMLEFACRELWDNHDSKIDKIYARELAEIGGVTGALAQHAKKVLQEFSSEERAIARPLFLELVTPEKTRRTVAHEKLAQRFGTIGAKVIEKAIDARLLVSRREQGSEDAGTWIELAHESLIIRWEDLVRWIEEDQESLILRNELEPRYEEWIAHKRHKRYALDADMIGSVRSRLQRGIPLSQEHRNYLAASELEEQSRVRRNRWLIAGAIGILSIVAGLAGLSAYQQREIKRAAGDIGLFELSLEPFDWSVETSTRAAVPISALSLDWRLHKQDPRRPWLAAGSIEPEERTRVEGGGTYQRVDKVEVRSVPMLLEVFGRGRSGEVCGSSWIPLVNVPGFEERNADKIARISLRVPTCQASSVENVKIPAGDFYRSGAGDPPMTKELKDEKVINLEDYLIDRTEVSNAHFQIFASMETFTGIAMPIYPTSALYAGFRQPDAPVVNVNLVTAQLYCAFMGKRLPTTEEWEKAARGGIQIPGANGSLQPNAFPRRNYPWGPTWSADHANFLTGDAPAIEPVTTRPQGKSPYGVLNMLGNVNEWTSSPADPNVPDGMMIIRGGACDTPPTDQFSYVTYENSRNPRMFTLNIGIRCAADTVASK